MPRTDIVIVGAGAAGLAAGAALKRLGREPVLLDRDDRVGGTWARRYERLHLHTVRRFSGLPYHGISPDLPRYVPKDGFARYLEEYAIRLGLDVRLGHAVSKVRSENGTGGWLVETDRGDWRTRAVVVATGHYNREVVPRWEGLDAFRGRLLHSVHYDSGREFAGLKTLVVGIGNSGAEIAADLAEQGAEHVAISVRTSPPIVPRELFGVVPVQILGILLTPVPAPRLLDRLGAAMRRLGTGDLRPYGLGKAGWGPFTARRPALIDVGFLRELKAGRIQVRPNVRRFTAAGVQFVDGTEAGFDAVIVATGFDTGLAELLDIPGAIGEDGEPRFRSGRPTPFPGLYFIGFDETTRGHLFEANREARRLGRAVARYLETSGVPTGDAA